MAEELERNGNKAIVDEDYDQALSLYTQAIELEPKNPSLYVSRAAAHIKLQSYSDAVADANRALQLSPGLLKAQLRKGIACFYLQDYRTAKAAFDAGAALDPSNSQFKLWIHKCNEVLFDEHNTETPLSLPSSGLSNPNGTISVVSNVAATPPMETVNGSTNLDARKLTECSPLTELVQLPKYRHEWYQTQTQTVVTIFAKNIKQEEIKVEFREQIVNVVIDRPNEESYHFQLCLFGKIKPLESKYTILSTKVEIRLAKSDSMQWKGLENEPTKPCVQSQLAVQATRLPPKKPTKNWDKLEAEVKQAEKDEKLDGDAGLNKLFQDIYRNADEDTRRAMNKSFVESNGTVLSTNWKEVGAKLVEGSPPKGMELKKWEH